MMTGLKIGQLWAGLGLDTSEFNRQIAQVDNSLKNTSNNMMSTAQKFRSFGWLATSTITAPMALAAKSVATAGMEFEFSMKKMIGLAGVAEGSIAGLSKVVKDLSVSTGVAPQKLADTLYFIESSGLKGKRALDALEMSAKGSAAGMGEAKDIANLLTGAMNAYETEGLTAVRVMDVLTATIREGKAEPAQLVSAFGSILPIAQQLGLGVEEIGGALATMTLTTASTANSATYLRSVLFHLLDPAPQVKKAFIGMKTSIEEVQDMLRVKGFDYTMKYLDKLTASYGKTLAEVLPDLRSLLGALNYTGQAAEKTAGIMGRVDKSTGDFGRNYEGMANIMKNSWNRALASLKVSSIDLGTIIGPYLTKMFETLAGWLRSITSAFMKLSPVMQKVVMGFLTFLAVLGPLALISSTVMFIINGLIPVIMGLKAAFIAVKIAVIGFNTVMALNPYMAAFTALMLLASAYLLMGDRMRTVSAEQKAQNSIGDEVTKQYSAQAGEILTLIALIENENLSNEKRIQAIGKLKTIMPEYNGTLSNEGILINHNTKEIDNYLIALQKKIKYQVTEQKLTEAFIKLEEARMKASKILNEVGQTPSLAQYLGLWFTPQELWEMANKEQIKAQDELKIYTKLFNDLVDSMKENPIKTPVPNLPEVTVLGKMPTDPVATLGLIEAQEAKIKLLQEDITKSASKWRIDQLLEQLRLAKIELDRLNELSKIPGLTSQKNFTNTGNSVIPTTKYDTIPKSGTGLSNLSNLSILTDQEWGMAKFVEWLEDAKTGADALYISMYRVGEQIGKSLQMGAASWKEYGVAVKMAAREFITAEISKSLIAAITAAVTNAGSFGPYAVAAIPVLIGAALGMVNTAINQVPSFADGGLVYGNTLAQVGEYPGAASNPEVIAPLNKLQSILGGQNTAMQGQVEFVIKGDQLVGILNKQNKRNSIY